MPRMITPERDPWSAVLVWTVCLLGCATWLGAVYVAGHFVHKFW